MTVTLALFEQYDSQCIQTSNNTECLVGYSVYFLFKYLFICEKYYTLNDKVCLFYTFIFLIHFQMI